MTSLDLTTAPDATKRSERLAQWTRVLCVLFFFSGFPALIYPLTWQRQLFLIFGVNIEAVTIVVTAFMLGLELGSLAGGWLSKRPAIPPLPLLAAIELLTGAFGVVSLSIFDKAGEWAPISFAASAPFLSPGNRARRNVSAAGCAAGRRDGTSAWRGFRVCRY
jgi:hypothetical protein